jgi:hypothetical protein
MTDALTLQVVLGKASPLAVKMVKEEQAILFGSIPEPIKDVLCINPAYGKVPPGEGAAECVYDPSNYVWLPREFRYFLSDDCRLAVPIHYNGAKYACIRDALVAAKYFRASFFCADHRRAQIIASFYNLGNPNFTPVPLLDSELVGWDEAEERYSIYLEVFLKCPVRQQALLATQDATLNCQMGDHIFHFERLEIIRDILRYNIR